MSVRTGHHFSRHGAGLALLGCLLLRCIRWEIVCFHGISDGQLYRLMCGQLLCQVQVDGSNEPGASEAPSLAVTKAIAAEFANGYTINVHNGDLCASHSHVRSSV
jgi:hypothetical protein